MNDKINEKIPNQTKIDMNSYLRHIQQERDEKNSFRKMLIIMTILFI